MITDYLVIDRKLISWLCRLVFFAGCAVSTLAHATFDIGKSVYDADNFTKARAEWTKCAIDGDPKSQFHLGLLFDDGTGVKENNVQAYFWYSMASMGGMSDAKVKLEIIASEMSEQEIDRSIKLVSHFKGVYAHDGVAKGESTNDSKGSDQPKQFVAATKDTDLIGNTEGESDVVNTDSADPNAVTVNESSTMVEETVENPDSIETVIDDQETPSAPASSPAVKSAALKAGVKAKSETTATRIQTPLQVTGRLADLVPDREKMKTVICEVQEMLNDLGYAAGPEDGVIGVRTRAAVERFQKETGLPDTGEIEAHTIRALRERQ